MKQLVLFKNLFIKTYEKLNILEEGFLSRLIEKFYRSIFINYTIEIKQSAASKIKHITSCSNVNNNFLVYSNAGFIVKPCIKMHIDFIAPSKGITTAIELFIDPIYKDLHKRI